MENEAKTITISVDEYFDLRMRAEQNTYLTNELGYLRGVIETIQHRLSDLEQKVEK